MRTPTVITIAIMCAQAATSQEWLGDCQFGDDRCYQRHYEAACATIPASTEQTCMAWIRALSDRVGQGDRAAWRAQGAGYGAMAQHLAMDEQHRATSRERALAVYRQIVALDPMDADSMLGVATFTHSEDERLSLLREVARLRPVPLNVRFLARELRRIGSTEALLEAADSLRAVYQGQSGRVKWGLASEAIELYEQAGEVDQARSLRRLVREDLEQSASIEDGATNDQIVSGAQLRCDPSVTAAAGLEPCLIAFRGLRSRVSAASDAAQRQNLASVYAGIIIQVAGGADSVVVNQLREAIEELHELGVSTVDVWRASALLEPSAVRRLQALEQALRLDPDNGVVLASIASEHMQQRRWEDAERLYGQAKESADMQTPELQSMLDHNIEAARKMREVPELRNAR